MHWDLVPKTPPHSYFQKMVSVLESMAFYFLLMDSTFPHRYSVIRLEPQVLVRVSAMSECCCPQ